MFSNILAGLAWGFFHVLSSRGDVIARDILFELCMVCGSRVDPVAILEHLTTIYESWIYSCRKKDTLLLENLLDFGSVREEAFASLVRVLRIISPTRRPPGARDVQVLQSNRLVEINVDCSLDYVLFGNPRQVLVPWNRQCMSSFLDVRRERTCGDDDGVDLI